MTVRRALGRARCAALVTISSALAAAAGLAGCKAKERATPPAAAEGEPAASAPPPLASDASAPARCVLSAGGLALASAEERRFLSIGDAVEVPGGFALGLVKTVAGNMHASIARVKGDLSGVAVVDLGPIREDAPPPRPLVHDGVLYALTALAPASRVEPARAYRDAGSPRRVTPLVLSRIGDASAETLGAVLESADESQAGDALVGQGSALVTWDEDAAARDRGVVKVARIALETAAPGAPPPKPETGTIVSPEGSDAEGPRLAPRDGGAWLVWSARRPEPVSDATIDDTRIESPAERRVFQWIEVVALDARGALAGPVRRLTAATGHAAAFDLATRAGGELDVFLRDDDEAGEGSGGSIRRYTVRGDGVEGPVVIAAEGAGRGALDVITGPAGAWLTYEDPSDHARLVPLEGARAAAASSVEGALDGARLLVALTGGPSLVAAFPGAETQLRRVVCAR